MAANACHVLAFIEGGLPSAPRANTMNVRAFAKVDKDTFWRFVTSPARGDGERYEYVRGRIVQQMTGGTLRHSQLGRRLARLIEDQLDPGKWITSGSDRGVETSQTIRYPDVSVERVGGDPDSLATARPVLIAEVLSHTTEERDLDVKPAEYMELSSLQAYIVASQTEAACLAWVRGPDGTFPATPREYQTNDVIEVPTLGIALSLPAIYRGIKLSPDSMPGASS